jgi:hypothetical protein
MTEVADESEINPEVLSYKQADLEDIENDLKTKRDRLMKLRTGSVSPAPSAEKMRAEKVIFIFIYSII